MELGFQEQSISESVGFYFKLATSLLFFVLLTAWSFSSNKRKGRLPLGPIPLPIINNLDMLGDLPNRALAALSMKHGPLMSLGLAAEQLTYNFADLTQYGTYLRKIRKLCASALLSSKHLDYVHFPFIREEEVSTMISSIINSDDSHPLNMRKSVSSLATAITCRMPFGKRLDGFAGCQSPDEATTQDQLLEKVIDEHVTQDDTKLTHEFVDVFKGE
eukprot:PITA_19000